MRSALRFSLLVFAGLAVLQAAWIVTMPPFRGSDEFDHVFRAVGAADGQWRLSVDTPEGRGLLVTVPSDVVEAASPQCDALEYTGRDNCFAVEEFPDGRVSISTAAGAYHPAYYFVIGSVGQFFEGAGVDYAMRAASSLLSAIGVSCAAFCLVLAGGGRWARFGFLAALTPVAVYTSTMPAPNAMEIVAGMCLWTALIGLSRDSGELHHQRLFLVVATVAACVLVTVRTLGPMWLGLIVLTMMFWVGWRTVRSSLRRNRWSLLGAAAVVTSALAAGVWWTMSADLVGPAEGMDRVGQSIEVDLGLQPMVWILQIIAAFPLRGEVAPPAVYAAYVVVVAALLLAAFRCSRGRKRLVLLASVILIVCLPIALTLATVQSQGVIWQGRYGLPFAAGLTLLSGLALDDAGTAPREGVRLRVIGCALLAMAHAVGIVHVLAGERGRPVSVADSAWLAPPAAIVTMLVIVGWLVWTLAMSSPSSSVPTSRPDAPNHDGRQAADRARA